MRSLKPFVAAVALSVCIPCLSVIVCFDYVHWRALGVDPMKPIAGKDKAKGPGIGVKTLRDALEKDGYDDFPITTTAHDDPAKAQKHLRVGDVVILGDAHVGIVSTPDGRIDHWLQVYGESGLYRDAATLPLSKEWLKEQGRGSEIKPPIPKEEWKKVKDEDKGGLYLGDDLATFLKRPFKPDPNCKVVVWRKK